MNFSSLIGQILDEKYRIERELGKGGMGSVYLAMHVGTERPVAVKVISPQFMSRPEFIERFRREARAAGRLRHPNVVNVTDFGFALTTQGQVAYLVMEYLDGCTLGEILEEEKNLPLDWTLDILEQVCSAVHEAHRQGIIHRDLKPDNIWLEPNQRGGYTVKVLDFGIAKLEEAIEQAAVAEAGNIGGEVQWVPARPTRIDDARNLTAVGGAAGATFSENSATSIESPAESSPAISEAQTVVQAPGAGTEARTAIITPVAPRHADEPAALGTRLISSESEGQTVRPAGRATTSPSAPGSSATESLTRVGAVLGTPLYMSPEQCRGERLDARSDIYSLGVIAYQMLSGSTPFSGDFASVMEAHKNIPAPPLNARRVRKRVQRVIDQALSKDPEKRPPSAESFASEIRAQAEGIGGLLRRALVLYSAHLPMFLGLAVLLYIPFAITTLLNIGVNVLFLTEDSDSGAATAANIILSLISAFTGIFCGYLIVGTTTWLVNQVLAVPLRPLKLKPALEATRNNWKKLVGTGILATFLTFVGYAVCLLPGMVLSVLLALVAPVVMMESLKGFAAMKRSKQLVMRSLRTTAAAVFIMFAVPFITAGVTSFFVAVTVKAFTPVSENARASQATADGRESAAPPGEAAPPARDEINLRFGSDNTISFKDDNKGMSKRIKEVVRESLAAILMLPFQILLSSLSSIIVALLYFKTRQAGGESMKDLLEKFEDNEQPRKKWQERVRQRLMQSGGRVTSRS